MQPTSEWIPVEEGMCGRGFDELLDCQSEGGRDPAHKRGTHAGQKACIRPPPRGLGGTTEGQWGRARRTSRTTRAKEKFREMRAGCGSGSWVELRRWRNRRTRRRPATKNDVGLAGGRGGGLVGRRALSPCSGGKPHDSQGHANILSTSGLQGFADYPFRTGFKLTAWFRRIVLQRALLCIYIYIYMAPQAGNSVKPGHSCISCTRNPSKGSWKQAQTQHPSKPGPQTVNPRP